MLHLALVFFSCTLHIMYNCFFLYWIILWGKSCQKKGRWLGWMDDGINWG